MATIPKLLLCLAPIGWSSLAIGATLIVPNSNIFPGNTTAEIPTGPVSIEYQQLLGSGQFHSNPITISAISFRAAAGTGPVNATVGNLTLTLSSSPKSPNGAAATLMSATYSDNVGKDQKVVFSGSNIALKSPGCPANNVCPFDITIVLQTPFVYAPSAGPLLMDLVETNLGGTGKLDAQSYNAPGGSVALVSGTVGAPTGTFAYQGNITQLTYTTTAPMISGVVNVASSIPPGMSNYAIAQGSLFAVYGSQMGPADLVVSSLPFPTTAGLSGTNLSVGVNGTGYPAPVYFTRGDIVVGVMPSNAPPGNGNITVVYKGQSGTVPITIVQSNFGISNGPILNANNGLGVLNVASVTFPDYRPVTETNTAKPGDVLTVWGTGLGATPNNGGDTDAPPFGNIGAAPQVFIGGVASPSVKYWGRAPGSIPGLDQINFEVPAGAPLGCKVSIVVQTVNGANPIVSNAPTIALAETDGATCSDPTQFVPSSALTVSSAKVLYLEARQHIDVNIDSNGAKSADISSRGEALAFQQTQAQITAFAPTVNSEPTFGSCYVGIAADTGGGGGGLDATILDQGPAVTFTPPSGAPLNLANQGGSGDYRSTNTSNMIPGGTWTFSNGSGGNDVGPLTFTFPVPQPVTWSNQAALTGSTIDRTKPLTITWTGGDSNGYVDIEGFNYITTSLNGSYYVGFQCAAPVAAGQFTVPSSILLAMPSVPFFARLEVNTIALPNIIGKVTGFDVALTGSNFQTQIPVIFK